MFFFFGAFLVLIAKDEVFLELLVKLFPLIDLLFKFELLIEFLTIFTPVEIILGFVNKGSSEESNNKPIN